MTDVMKVEITFKSEHAVKQRPAYSHQNISTKKQYVGS